MAKPSPKVVRSELRKAGIKRAIDRAMAAQNMSAPKVAEALLDFDDDVDAEKVRRWRQGTAELPLHLAQPLARLLRLTDAASDPAVVAKYGYDPMVMVRLFGLSPGDEETDRLLARTVEWPQPPTEKDVVDRLREIERLELELADYDERVAEIQHNRAAHVLVQAVEDSGKYAVAIWPVHTGPSARPEHQLHVSDRVDIRRLDGGRISEEEVWRDLGDHLSRARALVSSSHPRWASEGPRPDPHISMWNLRRLDIPRRPRVPHYHPGLPAITFSATVSSTWVGNLASIVALVLGYGVSSTIDLGRQLSGDARYKPTTEERNRVHSELLRSPGERRVWFHAAKDDPSHPHAPWAPTIGRAHPELVHIRLVEDDELLAATAEDRSHFTDYRSPDKDEWRTSRDRALETKPANDRVLVVPVTHAEWASTAKWEQTFDRAAQILRFLEDLGIRPWPNLASAQTQWVANDTSLIRPAFTRLRQQGAPFVYAP